MLVDPYSTLYDKKSVNVVINVVIDKFATFIKFVSSPVFMRARPCDNIEILKFCLHNCLLSPIGAGLEFMTTLFLKKHSIFTMLSRVTHTINAGFGGCH